MLVAIDTGNTNTVFGIYQGSDLKASFRVSSRRDATLDEWLSSIDGLLSFKGIDRRMVDSACIASVVPSVGSMMEDVVRSLFPSSPWLCPGTRTGISICYESPSDVGPDRIVNAVAAHARYGMNDRHRPGDGNDVRCRYRFGSVSGQGDCTGNSDGS